MSTMARETMEKPILFTGAMVRAILEGRKTQTRRVSKIQPEPKFKHLELHRDGTCEVGLSIDQPNYYQIQCPCPIGTKLWVKETFARLPCNQEEPCLDCQNCRDGRVFMADDPEREIPVKWKPSIFMPKWAARIWLTVTNVQVQRLCEMSNDDARAEGCAGVAFATFGLPSFKHLWESINGKTHPWSSNPWVWAITFTRVNSTERTK